MLLGWGIYFVSSFIFEYASVPIVVAFVGVMAWLLSWRELFPVVDAPEKTASGGSTWGDVIIRIVGAVVLIFAITEYAPSLGATLSGLLTPFPIYTSVMVSTIHRRQGVASASQFVRGATFSLFTPAVFWLIVGSTIVTWGVGASYASSYRCCPRPPLDAVQGAEKTRAYLRPVKCSHPPLPTGFSTPSSM